MGNLTREMPLVAALVALFLITAVGGYVAGTAAEAVADEAVFGDHPTKPSVYVVLAYNETADEIEYTVVSFGVRNVSIQAADADTTLAPSNRLNLSGVPTAEPNGGGA